MPLLSVALRLRLVQEEDGSSRHLFPSSADGALSAGGRCHRPGRVPTRLGDNGPADQGWRPRGRWLGAWRRVPWPSGAPRVCGGCAQARRRRLHCRRSLHGLPAPSPPAATPAGTHRTNAVQVLQVRSSQGVCAPGRNMRAGPFLITRVCTPPLLTSCSKVTCASAPRPTWLRRRQAVAMGSVDPPCPPERGTSLPRPTFYSFRWTPSARPS